MLKIKPEIIEKLPSDVVEALKRADYLIFAAKFILNAPYNDYADSTLDYDREIEIIVPETYKLQLLASVEDLEESFKKISEQTGV